MKMYWPMAIVKQGNAFRTQWTYEPANTFESAEKQFGIWRDHYHYEMIAWWIDVQDKNGKERSMLRINKDLVKELWDDFGDVPMNPETECIEDEWGSFETGTERQTIWHWFEDTFKISVAEDLM